MSPSIHNIFCKKSLKWLAAAEYSLAFPYDFPVDLPINIKLLENKSRHLFVFKGSSWSLIYTVGKPNGRFSLCINFITKTWMNNLYYENSMEVQVPVSSYSLIRCFLFPFAFFYKAKSWSCGFHSCHAVPLKFLLPLWCGSPLKW